MTGITGISNDAPEDGKKSYLGAKQFEWLKRELLASKGVIKCYCLRRRISNGRRKGLVVQF